MPKNYTGFTAKTVDNLLLNAGAFFKNFKVGTDTFDTAVAAGKLLGATKGGGSFSAIPNMRPIEADGVRGKVKGLQVLDDWEIKMAANVLEVSKEGLALSLVSSNTETGEDVDYDVITANNSIKLDDYVENITYVGTKSGSNKPVIIQIYNALTTNGLTLTPQDKAEAVIAMEFEGHYSNDDLDTPPFKIFMPKNAVIVTETEPVV